MDPDQLVFQKPADLGQHCFLDISMFSILRVKFAGKNKILPVNSTITDQLKELRIQDTFRGELFLPRQDESKTRNDLTLRELHHKYSPPPPRPHIIEARSDQVRLFVGPDLDPNCFERLSAEDTSRKPVGNEFLYNNNNNNNNSSSSSNNNNNNSKLS